MSYSALATQVVLQADTVLCCLSRSRRNGKRVRNSTASQAESAANSADESDSGDTVSRLNKRARTASSRSAAGGDSKLRHSLLAERGEGASSSTGPPSEAGTDGGESIDESFLNALADEMDQMAEAENA